MKAKRSRYPGTGMLVCFECGYGKPTERYTSIVTKDDEERLWLCEKCFALLKRKINCVPYRKPKKK